MSPEALMTACRTLLDQTPEPGEDPIDATLRRLGLDPAALRDGAGQVGVSFAR
jgi:hypothetical protein